MGKIKLRRYLTFIGSVLIALSMLFLISKIGITETGYAVKFFPKELDFYLIINVIGLSLIVVGTFFREKIDSGKWTKIAEELEGLSEQLEEEKVKREMKDVAERLKEATQDYMKASQYIDEKPKMYSLGSSRRSLLKACQELGYILKSYLKSSKLYETLSKFYEEIKSDVKVMYGLK